MFYLILSFYFLTIIDYEMSGEHPQSVAGMTEKNFSGSKNCVR
ncbi:hypothetical protein F544_17770 [Bibersteinia trehalosi USDA-ARS-USMARC-190]|uniref:Uncharacterized protein n=1 Tax=Bibersteinia trehalosi USDA-ARS-USMARC-190 TaxID=1263832 RepID=W0R9L6_BIBTR|nr:hypothetical protein F544_17770 [Bibersteinia trehalosi USDA-ARS-USMARC-190]